MKFYDYFLEICKKIDMFVITCMCQSVKLIQQMTLNINLNRTGEHKKRENRQNEKLKKRLINTKIKC